MVWNVLLSLYSLPNSLREQFCSACIQKRNTRQEQNQRAQAERRQLLGLQKPDKRSLQANYIGAAGDQL